jgi:large subunit ribosomal protein L24
MARIRKGDTVYVNSGKHRGATGKVLQVLTEKGRVRIEGLNVVKRHLAANKDPKIPEGGIIQKFGTVHLSNVNPIDPQSGKPTRVGVAYLEAEGAKASRRRVRVARRSGETIA